MERNPNFNAFASAFGKTKSSDLAKCDLDSHLSNELTKAHVLITIDTFIESRGADDQRLRKFISVIFKEPEQFWYQYNGWKGHVISRGQDFMLVSSFVAVSSNKSPKEDSTSLNMNLRKSFYKTMPQR